MAGVNRVIILGRLGNDPEMRTMPNGDTVATLSIATSESWTDKNTGERKELTEWHTVIAYRKLADIMGQYLKKGAQVYIEGKLRTRKWQNKDGKDCYRTEIIADKLEMLGGTQSGNAQANAQAKPSNNNAYASVKNGATVPPPQNEDYFNDDIPF